MNKLIGYVATGFLLVWNPAATAQAPSGSNLNPVVMSVNDDPIYAFEISITMQNLLHRTGQAGKEANQEIVDVATQRMVEQKLLAQEARRFGLKADEKRVQERIDRAVSAAGGRESLSRTLTAAGSNLEQLQNFNREIDLGSVFIDKQVRPTVVVSDEEAQEYIDANPEMGFVDERVHARHILISLPENADLETDEKALARAEQARKRALAGEDFAKLARELSDGPSASNGGDLGFFTRKRMLPNFAEAAFELEAGEISDVVRTGFGYHVILVEEHLPAGKLDDATLKQRAVIAVTNQKMAKLVGELLRTLYDNAKIQQPGG